MPSVNAMNNLNTFLCVSDGRRYTKWLKQQQQITNEVGTNYLPGANCPLKIAPARAERKKKGNEKLMCADAVYMSALCFIQNSQKKKLLNILGKTS